MLFRLLLISVVFAGIVPCTATPRSDKDVASILHRLDSELNQRSHYINLRQQSIDSLQAIHRSDPSDMATTRRLGHLYMSFNNDSALAVYDRGYRQALNMGNDSMARHFLINRASLLPLAGFMSEAETDYQSVDTAMLNTRELIHYLSRGRQMYSYMSAYFHRFPEASHKFFARSLEAQSEMLKHLSPDEPDYLLNQGEYHYLTGRYGLSESLLRKLIDTLPEEDNRYARATHILADIAHVQGSANDYIYYLALSAIADTKGATREVTSLQELGQMMFENGDITRAHDYLYTALRNAVECNAETRMLQVAESVPLIESVHRVELDHSRRRIYLTMGAMALILVLLIVALLLLRIKIRQMKQLQIHLEQTNRIKEEYISQFLNLCSIYMDKLNQFCHLANRKISTGKVDDLYKLTKSGKFVETQTKEFYEVFDNAFLHIYPGFVESVNALLLPDKQITLPPGQLLNTDLRILAFMRLGIDDSARIAQILNYSINTIYTYRNKLKNRAINRDTFESDILSI